MNSYAAVIRKLLFTCLSTVATLTSLLVSLRNISQVCIKSSLHERAVCQLLLLATSYFFFSYDIFEKCSHGSVQYRRQKVFNRGALRFFRVAWHSKNWQILYWFIVFHVSIWGAKPTKDPRGDETGSVWSTSDSWPHCWVQCREIVAFQDQQMGKCSFYACSTCMKTLVLRNVDLFDDLLPQCYLLLSRDAGLCGNNDRDPGNDLKSLEALNFGPLWKTDSGDKR